MSNKYERRNARARAMGYSNYGALRRALETGKVQREGTKVSAPKYGKDFPLYQRAGFNTPQEYMHAQRENKAWIKAHAKSNVTKNPIKGFEKEFNIAFVQPNNNNKKLDIKHYMVDVAGVMSEAEFNRKYFNK